MTHRYLLWAVILQNKYKKDSLGTRLFQCFRPTLYVKTAWLHSNHIADALYVYEQQSSFDFKMYYAYSCTYDVGKKLVLDITKKKHAFVFNTSDGDGLHWVSFVVLLNPDNTVRMEFFDPLGGRPNQDIEQRLFELIGIFKKTFPTYDIRYDVYISSKRIQRDVKSCGIYTVAFIVSRLHDIPYTIIRTHDYLNDNICNELRTFFWNPITFDANTLCNRCFKNKVDIAFMPCEQVYICSGMYYSLYSLYAYDQSTQRVGIR